jgi:hypothetical protein
MIEPRSSHMLHKCSYHLSHIPSTL